MALPTLIHVKQKFEAAEVYDAESATIAELENLNLAIPPGMSVAITAGSRGIDRIPEVLRGIVKFLTAHGAKPFLVPAMGSHGGATAAGQVKILASLGVTEASVGAPILASMETIEVASPVKISINGSVAELPVLLDKYAADADAIIVVNRVKPHTSFHGEVESGILKMLTVGLGKAKQANNIHYYGTPGLKTILKPLSTAVLEHGKVIAGIGLLENAFDRLCKISAFAPNQIIKGESDLLALARCNMPKLPVDKIDLLIIDEMGKNFSGTGVDTNVIGRIKIENEPEPEFPKIHRIIIKDLSEASAGNAYGVGLADFITQKMFQKIDFNATYANVLATGFFERVKIPFIANDEAKAIELALESCTNSNYDSVRIVRIKNTLQLDEIWISPSIFAEIEHQFEIVK